LTTGFYAAEILGTPPTFELLTGLDLFAYVTADGADTVKIDYF